ncbi:MAG TPA: DNA polymerase III subunit delta' [Dehalococcoidia bacterium]|nr:DNA polymerase III subunit delta' [Dehalococcoidia bacterium]
MWQVIGQKRAVSLLQNGIDTGRLAHAYLLVGPAHVGKMTLAVNLAQALNCESGDRPCLECSACRKIASGTHADVQVIGLASNGDGAGTKLIGIDRIKQLQHTANLPPFEGKRKVFIIDGAELLSIEAANCLLKTLEEPMDDVTFILLTTNDRLLPETVVSRCQHLELRPLAAAEIETALVEKHNIEVERARLLAGISRGCPGWALAAAEDGSLLQQHEEMINQLVKILGADYEERFAFVVQTTALFAQNRATVYDMLDLWSNFWRDLMLVKMSCASLITNIDKKDEIVKIAERYRLSEVNTVIRSIQAASEQLKQNANIRLALEVLMLDIPGKERGGGKQAAPINR